MPQAKPDNYDSQQLYDSVIAIQRQLAAHGAHRVNRPASMAITIASLIAVLLSSLVITIAGFTLAKFTTAATPMAVIVTVLGLVILLWHIRALLVGSGRRTGQINPKPALASIALIGFGLTTGYALVELLIGVWPNYWLTCFIAGLVGLAAAFVIFIRDHDLAEKANEPQLTLAKPPVFASPVKRASEVPAELYDDLEAEANKPKRAL